jgi:hypothetical protein
VCSHRRRDGNSTSNGIDIICIVGGSRDVHLKDAFLLVGRVLPSSRLLGKLKFDSNALSKN